MKCSSCRFYQKSKVYGNHCICTGTKPCEVDRNNKKREHHKREERKRKEQYDRSKQRQEIYKLDYHND